MIFLVKFSNINVKHFATNIKSVNAISSLKDFEHCENLSELYIRNNNISDLNEIYYLKNLKNLKILWLADNECVLNTNDPNYRLTVLRNLPNLQKLDNQLVSKEELERSLEFGRLIEMPSVLDSNKFINSDINKFLMPLTDDLKALISSMEECECADTYSNDTNRSKSNEAPSESNHNEFEMARNGAEKLSEFNDYSSSDESNGNTIGETR